MPIQVGSGVNVGAGVISQPAYDWNACATAARNAFCDGVNHWLFWAKIVGGATSWQLGGWQKGGLRSDTAFERTIFTAVKAVPNTTDDVASCFSRALFGAWSKWAQNYSAWWPWLNLHWASALFLYSTPEGPVGAVRCFDQRLRDGVSGYVLCSDDMFDAIMLPLRYLAPHHESAPSPKPFMQLPSAAAFQSAALANRLEERQHTERDSAVRELTDGVERAFNHWYWDGFIGEMYSVGPLWNVNAGYGELPSGVLSNRPIINGDMQRWPLEFAHFS